MVRIEARLAPAGAERRRAERAAVTISGSIEGADEGCAATIRDLSEHGFMAETGAPCRPDTYVRLHLPVIGGCHARIVWAAAGRIGGEFVHPLDRDDLARLIATAA